MFACNQAIISIAMYTAIIIMMGVQQNDLMKLCELGMTQRCIVVPETELYQFARWAVLGEVDPEPGFLRGGQYAVCLALLVKGRVQVGALACPNLPLDPSASATEAS